MANSVTFIGEIADAQFEDWRDNNEDAFCLNVIGKDAMIHKADCWHLVEEPGRSSTGNSKICSNNREDLKKWVKDNNKKFKTCSDCMK